jgi:hypothetical protein
MIRAISSLMGMARPLPIMRQRHKLKIDVLKFRTMKLLPRIYGDKPAPEAERAEPTTGADDLDSPTGGDDFCDFGEQTLKNIARPILAYAVGLSANAYQTAPLPSSAPLLSIVFLPFANISGDPEQEYFVDGVTETLTTDTSRISGAFEIACNTAFTFKGKAIDVRSLGRELSVRSVLRARCNVAANASA